LIVDATLVTSPAQEKKPNVVFILADSVGYGDTGPYSGGKPGGMPRANVDELARQGMRLTQYLVEAACSPKRRSESIRTLQPAIGRTSQDACRSAGQT
jgi:hypothetical protein